MAQLIGGFLKLNTHDVGKKSLNDKSLEMNVAISLKKLQVNTSHTQLIQSDRKRK